MEDHPITAMTERLARRITELEAEHARLRALLTEAHDAMMAWHFAHGGPDGDASDEERAMGAVCRAVQEQIMLDAGRPGDGEPTE